ncbi:hypothetical protein HaLaN_12430 [Haematococcus lacustris]|uniref:Uncharacterized protein n=1 Tax=Haematococcus lacustris TaxID=44745 RepID=A0A699ZA22_HAELA|nr:hypothetical protein HaLaN_12430 [Haematococcus lacustris]
MGEWSIDHAWVLSHTEPVIGMLSCMSVSGLRLMKRRRKQLACMSAERCMQSWYGPCMELLVTTTRLQHTDTLSIHDTQPVLLARSTSQRLHLAAVCTRLNPAGVVRSQSVQPGAAPSGA